MSWIHKVELDRDKCEVFHLGSKNQLHEDRVGKTWTETSSLQQKLIILVDHSQNNPIVWHSHKKKTNIIFSYISRNTTSKLIGRNSPIRLCPAPTSGLARCLAHRQHSTNTCHTNEWIPHFQMDLETKMVRDLETVLRREGWTNREMFNLEKTKETHMRAVFNYLKEFHIWFCSRGGKIEGQWLEDTQR